MRSEEANGEFGNIERSKVAAAATMATLLACAPAFGQPASLRFGQPRALPFSGPAITPIAAIHSPQWRSYAGTGVAVEGVVTQHATEPWGFTMQDATDGIYVETDGRTGPTDVAVGDRVLVTGTVNAGEFAPIVKAARLIHEGRGPLPKPHPVTEPEVSGGALDNLFVEIRGTVRAVARGFVSHTHPAAFLTMEAQDRSADSVQVVLTNLTEDPIRYVDAEVAARGVVSVLYNGKRQALGLKVMVDSPRDLTVLRAPAAGPFAIGLTPIGELMKWSVKRDWSRRVRVSGTLTLQRPGEYMVLQDGADAMRVDSESPEKLKPGARVEATGFVSASGYSAWLRNAVIRCAGAGDRVIPARRWPKQLLTGSDDDLLVTTSATVRETGRVQQSAVLTLESDGIQFETETPAPAAKALRPIQPGARVEVTGVCHITADARGRPRSFAILARSADDIRVLTPGPAMTVAGIAWGGGLVGGGALLCALWALMLRRRVREQTEWIQESLDREHRTARMMAQRSAILERVGRNEALDAILSEIMALAEAHMLSCGAAIRLCVDGEEREMGRRPEGSRAGAGITASSNSGRIRVAFTVARKPRTEQESEALEVCRECLVLAVEHRDLHEQLIEQSLSDPLTRLPNRRSFDERFQMALEEARRQNEPMAVFALDLDAFKEVNDMLGHAAGDAVLREMSRRFSAAMRRSDVLARVGGDEFLALLPKIGDRARAMEVVERLLASAAPDMEVNGIRLSPSVSIGAAFYPEDGEDAETLRNTADMRMYEHKMNPAKRPRGKQRPAPAEVAV